MRLLIHILVNSLALMVVAGYFESFYLDGFLSAIVASILLTVLNLIVKPFLILLTLPVTFLTMGLFLFVINGITLMIAEGIMGASFVIDGFGMAVLASIIISIINVLIQNLIKKSIKRG